MGPKIFNFATKVFRNVFSDSNFVFMNKISDKKNIFRRAEI